MLNDGTHKGIEALVKASLVVAIVGALNWGLVGFFNWNLVDAIFGGDPREVTSTASRVVYALVGVAGLMASFLLARRGSAAHRPASTEPYTRQP
jgi:uncharacterized protein